MSDVTRTWSEGDLREAVVAMARRRTPDHRMPEAAAILDRGFDAAYDAVSARVGLMVGDAGLNPLIAAIERASMHHPLGGEPAGDRTVLFALPFHGSLSAIQAFCADPEGRAEATSRMVRLGLVGPDSRVVLSRLPLDAMRVNELTPHGLAWLARAAHEVLGDVPPALAVGPFEAAIDAAMTDGPVREQMLQDGVRIHGSLVLLGARRAPAGTPADYLDDFADPRLTRAGELGSRLAVGVDAATAWENSMRRGTMPWGVGVDAPTTPKGARSACGLFHLEGSLAALRRRVGVPVDATADAVHVAWGDDLREVVVCVVDGPHVLGPIRLPFELAHAEVETFPDWLLSVVGDPEGIVRHDRIEDLPAATRGMGRMTT